MKGLLTPIYEQVGTRDRLAELTGISPQVLSAYNNGQPLGRRNAEKIVAAVPGLTLDHFGIPPVDSQVSLESLHTEITEIRAILTGRTSWLSEIEDQLKAQTNLLAAMSAMAASLHDVVAELSALAKDLRVAAGVSPEQEGATQR